MTTRLRKLSLALLPAMALFTLTAMPGSVLGQEEEIRGRSPGFRTDLGIYAVGGLNSCVEGGCKKDRISNVKWGTHLGVALGAVIRPFRFFSIGLDVSFTNLVADGTIKSLKRFMELNATPLFRIHIPVRFRTVVFEPVIGWGLGLTNGYIDYEIALEDGRSSKRFYGLGMTTLLGFKVFWTPKLGLGFEMRFNNSFYQQTCDKFVVEGGDERVYCTSYKTSNMTNNDENLDNESEYLSAPFKLFYGLSLIYYF